MSDRSGTWTKPQAVHWALRNQLAITVIGGHWFIGVTVDGDDGEIVMEELDLEPI